MVQYVSVAGESNGLVKVALKWQWPSTLLEDALLKVGEGRPVFFHRAFLVFTKIARRIIYVMAVVTQESV